MKVAKHHILFLVGTLSLLQLSGLALRGSLSFLLLIWIQFSLGGLLTRTIDRGRTRSFLDPVAIAVGVSSFTILKQLARLTGSNGFQRNLALAIMVLAIVTLSKSITRPASWKQLFGISSEDTAINLTNQEILSVLLAASLLLSITWTWVIALVGVLLSSLLITLTPSRMGLKLRIPLVAIGLGFVFLLALLIDNRDIFWWLPGWGVDERKLFADSVGQWGPMSDALSAGIPLKYQWFTYSILSDWSQFSFLTTFEVVSRADQVVSAILLGLCAKGIADDFGFSKKQTSFAAILSASSITILSHPVSYSLLAINYMPLASFLLACYFIQLLRWQRSPSTEGFAIMTFLATAAVAAKSVHLVPIAIGTVCVALTNLRADGFRKILIQIAILSTVLCSYVYIFFPSASRAGLEGSQTFSFLRDLGFVIEPNEVRVVFGAAYLLALAMPAVLIVVGLRDRKYDAARIWIGITTLAGLVFAIFFERTSGTQLHFLQVAITASILCLPLVTLQVSKTLIHSFFVLRKKTYVFAAFLIFSNVMAHLAIFHSIQVINDRALALTNFLAFSLILLGIFLLKLSRQSKGLSSIIAFACFLFPSFLPVNWVTNWRRPIHQAGASEQLGSADLSKIASIIMAETPQDSIGATDLLFSDNNDYCPILASDGRGTVIDQAKLNNYFTPAVIVERRFLVVAPNYGFYLLDSEPDSRISASLEFGCNPSNTSRLGLTTLGVDWFISRNTALPDFVWEEVGRVVYRTKSLIFIKLIEPNHH